MWEDNLYANYCFGSSHLRNRENLALNLICKKKLIMSLNWGSKNYPFYCLRRDLTRPYAMALNNGTTTVESLIRIVEQTNPCCGLYYRSNYIRDNYDMFYNINCDEVYPNIFIGDGTTAKNKEYLKKIGITHVLNTAEGKAFSMVDTDRHFYEDVGIKYLGFHLLDHPNTNISEYFYQASDFIQNAISSGGKVYVHCLMGISRSSTCVLAYLMLKKGMSAVEAIRIVKEKRAIHPNDGFLQQLADLDNALKREKRQ